MIDLIENKKIFERIALLAKNKDILHLKNLCNSNNYLSRVRELYTIIYLYYIYICLLIIYLKFNNDDD